MPDISIITPAYNRAMLLPRVWLSIASQEVDLEWIVVDDASEDDTEKAVKAIGDKRISYVRMPENRGVNAARNKGVTASHGRLIVFLDSDDELYPHALQDAVDLMKRTEERVGVALFACINSRNGQKINQPADGRLLNEYDIVCGGALTGGDMICVYRREVFNFFELPERLIGCEQVFVFQISKKYDFIMVDRPLSIVHRQYDNLSNGDSLVSRSLDIARSYEILIENHSDVLKKSPSALNHYLQKAMYRYGVAGSRGNVWRIYKNKIRLDTGYITKLADTSLMGLCMMGPAGFERRRVNRMNRKLELS